MIELQNTSTLPTNFTKTSALHDHDHVPYIEETEEAFPLLPSVPTHAPIPTPTTAPPTYNQCTDSSSASSSAPSGQTTRSIQPAGTLPGISLSAVQQSQATLTAQQFESLYGHVEEVVKPFSHLPCLSFLLSCVCIYVPSLYLPGRRCDLSCECVASHSIYSYDTSSSTSFYMIPFTHLYSSITMLLSVVLRHLMHTSIYVADGGFFSQRQLRQ